MAKGYIFDKLLNRKIEGETNLAKESDISSENENFVDEVLASLQNEDVKAKTLEQSEPNFAYDFTTAITTAFNNLNLPNCEIEVAFAKVVEYNHILLIVASFKITNNGESSVSAGSFSPQINLSDIADKIIDQNGTPLNQATDASTRIAGAIGITSANRSGSHATFATSLYRGSIANIALLSLDYRAMNSGASSYTDLRLELIV